MLRGPDVTDQVTQEMLLNSTRLQTLGTPFPCEVAISSFCPVRLPIRFEQFNRFGTAWQVFYSMVGQIYWLLFAIILGSAVWALQVLDQGGFSFALISTPPVSGKVSVTWSWQERVALFLAGAWIGCFIFVGDLSSMVSPPARPVHAEPALGYTYLFAAKYGSVYGTYFEWWTVTYGAVLAWLGGLSSFGLFYFFSEIPRKSRTFPLQAAAAGGTWAALYHVIWRLSH
jgi:hypothetical protein